MKKKRKHRVTVSVALISIFLDYVKRIGIDPRELCQTAGIDFDALKDMNSRVDAKAFKALFDAAVQKADDPNFGLNCIKDVAHHYRGGISFSVSCSTVRMWLRPCGNFSIFTI